MKNKLFLVLALIGFVSLATSVLAQEAASQTAQEAQEILVDEGVVADEEAAVTDEEVVAEDEGLGVEMWDAETDVTKEEAIEIAKDAAKQKGIDIEGASIVYDEGGKLWCETAGFAIFEDASPNHGILKNGFLKNYRIVFFDFKDPLPDVWVFIDKDTGEVLEVSK